MNNIPQCQELATKAELQLEVTELTNQIDRLRNEINNLLGKRAGGGSTIDVLTQGNLFGTEINNRLIEDFELEIDANTGDIQTMFFVGGPGSTLNRVVKTGATQTFRNLKTLANGGYKLGRLAWQLSTNADNRAKFNEAVFKEIADIIDNNEKLKRTEIAIRSANKRGKSVLELLDKANGDVNQTVQGVRDYKQVVADNKLVLEDISNTYAQQQNQIRDLEYADFLQRDAIAQTNQNIADIVAQINQDNLLDTQFKTEVLSELFATELRLNDQNAQIDELENFVRTLSDRLSDTEDDIQDIIFDFTDIEIEQDSLEARVLDIENFLQNDPDIQAELQADPNALVPNTTPNVIKRMPRRGGVPVNVRNQIIDQRKGLIETLSDLAGNPATITDPSTGLPINIQDEKNKDYSDIVLGDSNLPTVIRGLINLIPDFTSNPNTTTQPQVTPQELDDWGIQLRRDLNDDFDATITAIVTNTLTPPLSDLLRKTEPSSIRTATKDGICEEINDPNGCLETGLKRPLLNASQNLLNQLSDLLSDLRDVLDSQILDKLETIEDSLDTAWRSTTVDKTLNATNTSLLLHNAMMLSRDLETSMAEVLSNGFDPINVTNSEGNNIDVNSYVSNKVSTFVNLLIGQPNTSVIVNPFNSASRILTSAQGIVGSVRGAKDALQHGQEIIANRIATLGNTAMSQGIYEDNSFPWMDTNTNFREPFEKFTYVVRDLQEVTDETNELVQTGIEVQENVQQTFNNASGILTAREELEQTFSQFDVDREVEEDTAARDSASPDIEPIDLIEEDV